jgi:hypothetical protein
MSWFKHSPIKHPPQRPHPHPHRTSPAAERMLEQAKSLGPDKKKKDQAPHN